VAAGVPVSEHVRSRLPRRHAKKLTEFEKATGWRYQLVVTNIKDLGRTVPGSHHVYFLNTLHSQHAVVEDRVRTEKATGIRTLPFHDAQPVDMGTCQTSPRALLQWSALSLAQHSPMALASEVRHGRASSELCGVSHLRAWACAPDDQVMNSRRRLLATLTAAAVLATVTSAFASADTPRPIPAVAATAAEGAMLARWHEMADPAADAAVADLYAHNEVDAVNTALAGWTFNGQPLPRGLPAKLHDFLVANLTLPGFTDQTTVRRAAVFQAQHSWAFLDASVLGSAPARTRYPGITAGLVRDLGPNGDTPESGAKASRIVTALMSADPLGPSGDLLVTALKVRLVHAAGRCLLRQGWDYARFGPPISILYMAAEYQTFTIEVIDALARIGVPMSDAQAQDFVDVWRVIGTILGLPIEAMPPTVARTRHLGDVLGIRLENIDATAVNYVAGDIAAQARFFDPPVPQAIGRPLFAALTRMTLGDAEADAFAIPRNPFWDAVAQVGLPVAVGGLTTVQSLGAATAYTPTIAMMLRRMLDNARNADIVLPPQFHPAR
jgi:hypothetical protein